ncbi:MAG: hypothetical protein WD794_05435 [Mycobacteriales bacterium]
MSFGVVGISVAGLMWVSAAFACSPLPKVSSVSPESGAPGETVQVEGEVRTGAPVEIRWNGVGGELLAVSRVGGDGMLSVPVRIPDVSPGIYSLTLVTSDVGVARTAVEVTAPGGSLPVAAPQLWPTSLAAQPLDAASASNGVSSLGVALLGVGLVGLFAGTTVAVARTRRVPAGPRS